MVTLNDLRFLDKEDGGTWRFRHQILQDYFAEKWAGGEWRQAWRGSHFWYES